MSKSYAATMDHLRAGDVDKARQEYQKNFGKAVANMYSVTAQVYPPKFRKINDWCSAIAGVARRAQVAESTISTAKSNVDALKADGAASDAAIKEKTEPAINALESVRVQFYLLHSLADLLKANDHLFAFRYRLRDDAPSVPRLKELKDKIVAADPPRNGEENPEAYRKARSEWLQVVNPILEDDKIEEKELASLREATEAFYREYGRVFE